MRGRKSFLFEPLISIVIPLYKTPLNYLEELLQSVVGQTYENWQLCLADGSGSMRVEEYVKRKYKKRISHYL